MKKYLVVVLVVLAAFCTGVVVEQLKNGPKQPQQALIYPEPKPLSDFSLLNEQGETIGLEALKGRWTFVFVGYTFCPDICPMTMAKFAAALPRLQAMTTLPVEVWFVSVDPQRDTPELMAQYVKHFNQPALKARTAEHPQLFPFVRQLGLMYSVPERQEGRYLVDHSASIALVNPQAEVAAIVKAKFEVGQIPLVDTTILLEDFPLVLERSEG